MLELREVAARLPYGPSARLISDVIAHRPGGLTTEMGWSLEDPRIRDHFAGGPHVVPGVFLAEQVAQSALLLALLDGFVADGERYTLGALRCQFLAPALAPCVVRAETVLAGQARGAVGFMGECWVGSVLSASIKGVATPAPA